MRGGGRRSLGTKNSFLADREVLGELGRVKLCHLPWFCTASALEGSHIRPVATRRARAGGSNGSRTTAARPGSKRTGAAAGRGERAKPLGVLRPRQGQWRGQSPSAGQSRGREILSALTSHPGPPWSVPSPFPAHPCSPCSPTAAHSTLRAPPRWLQPSFK